MTAARAGVSRPRPKYLSLGAILFGIRLPLPAWVSILHRMSGVLLFVSGAWALYLLDVSLESESGFEEARMALRHPVLVIAGLVLLWALFHHFLAGVRFLLLDLGIGVEKKSARHTAGAVLAASLAATALAGWLLW